MNLFKGTQLQPNQHRNNKKKIINDPVYGFITIPDEIIFDILEHPHMQRLRRIMQLGLSHLPLCNNLSVLNYTALLCHLSYFDTKMNGAFFYL